jgi:hypothetical protein
MPVPGIPQGNSCSVSITYATVSPMLVLGYVGDNLRQLMCSQPSHIQKLRVHAIEPGIPQGNSCSVSMSTCQCTPPLISPGNCGDALRLLVCSQLDHTETESSCWGQVFPRAILAQSACPYATVFQHLISQVEVSLTMGYAVHFRFSKLGKCERNQFCLEPNKNSSKTGAS